MKKNILICPGCDFTIIKSYADEAKLRAKLLKWNRDGMFAICKSCGKEVPIDANVLKSLQGTFRYIIEENETCSRS